ncbi:MAG: tol-pal system protein YbgF [Rhizomicrobium sp.]|jgi:tol-pal system protein YbgF
MNKTGEMRARWAKPLLVAGLGLFLGSVALADAPPGDETAQALRVRLAADEAQAARLEGRIASVQDRTGWVQVADIFGESDKDKQERLQREQAQDSSIASLNQRVSDLEDTLRRLTGQMEQLDHRVSEFDARITRMQKDFDYKLCTLSAQQLSAGTGSDDPNTLPCNGSQTNLGATMGPPPAETGAPPPASNGPIHLAPPPGVLGTLPPGATLPQPTGPQAGAPQQTASIDTHPQFDAAMTLLAKAQYDEARAAFRNFADTHPKDDLTPQAIYWVGDIAYVQKDYPNAARAFAEELKRFSSSPRAPESMLRLGQSLLAMNQKKEGCTALAALPKSYPTASKTIEAQALGARKAAECR